MATSVFDFLSTSTFDKDWFIGREESIGLSSRDIPNINAFVRILKSVIHTFVGKDVTVDLTSEQTNYSSKNHVSISMLPFIDALPDGEAYNVILGVSIREMAHIMYSVYIDRSYRIDGKPLPVKDQVFRRVLNILEDRRIESKISREHPGYTQYLQAARHYFNVKSLFYLPYKLDLDLVANFLFFFSSKVLYANVRNNSPKNEGFYQDREYLISNAESILKATFSEEDMSFVYKVIDSFIDDVDDEIRTSLALAAILMKYVNKDNSSKDHKAESSTTITIKVKMPKCSGSADAEEPANSKSLRVENTETSENTEASENTETSENTEESIELSLSDKEEDGEGSDDEDSEEIEVEVSESILNELLKKKSTIEKDFLPEDEVRTQVEVDLAEDTKKQNKLKAITRMANSQLTQETTLDKSFTRDYLLSSKDFEGISRDLEDNIVWKDIEPVPVVDNYKHLSKQLKVTSGYVARTQGRLNSSFELSEGEIDEDALPTARVQRDVFYDTSRGKGLQQEIIILQDISGSMCCKLHNRHFSRMDYSKIILKAIAEGFSNLKNVKLGIYAHSADISSNGSTDIYTVHDLCDNSPLDMGKIEALSPVSNNRDHVAIQEVAKKFSSQRGQKLLIIISDGEPAAFGYSGNWAIEKVKRTVEILEKKNIYVLSVAVASIDAQRFMYKHCIEASDRVAQDLNKWMQRYLKASLLR